MTLLLNILWIILGGGIVIFFEYLLAGVLLCITIVGIPFGMQCFKVAGLGLMPFGKDLEPDPEAGVVSFGLNVLWFVLAGVWIFITHVALGVTLAVSIIGIPFAFQHLKLGLLALAPFGQRVRAA